MSSWAGNLIKLARSDAGLSQRELARRRDLAGDVVGLRSRPQVTQSRHPRAHRAGQDLRIRVVPYDDHDDAMAAYETSLPAKTRAAIERERERLRAQPGRERELA